MARRLTWDAVDARANKRGMYLRINAEGETELATRGDLIVTTFCKDSTWTPAKILKSVSDTLDRVDAALEAGVYWELVSLATAAADLKLAERYPEDKVRAEAQFDKAYKRLFPGIYPKVGL